MSPTLALLDTGFNGCNNVYCNWSIIKSITMNNQKSSFVLVCILLIFTTILFIITGCVKQALAPTTTQSPPEESGAIKVTWFGHAAFLITSPKGVRIITDPYATSKRLNYGDISDSADIVTVSHEHGDHNNVAAVGGNPEVVRETTEVQGIKFRAIAAYHDDSKGSKRGNNTIICFEIDGLKICHLGDLGHPLDDKHITDIGKVDILFIPVGGNYTIDAIVASQVCAQLNPSVIIPMHYLTDKCSLPISGVDEFLQGKQNVNRLDTNEVDFQSGQLPSKTTIIVLKPPL